MYCADCGSKMYVQRVSNGKEIPKYRCCGYTKIPVGSVCASAHLITADRRNEGAKKQLAICIKRAADLEILIQKIYVDNALGKLPDKRYWALSGQYETDIVFMLCGLTH